MTFHTEMGHNAMYICKTRSSLCGCMSFIFKSVLLIFIQVCLKVASVCVSHQNRGNGGDRSYCKDFHCKTEVFCIDITVLALILDVSH